MELPRRLSSAIVLVALVSSCVVFVWAPQNVSAYTLRDPIFINGDAMFTPENGVTGGAGTELDPYIIEGWEFDDMWDPGIEIWNTEAHFIIRGVYCHVASGTLGPDGIRLDNVRNGTIEACTIANTDKGSGVKLAYCQDVSLDANSIWGNSVGVRVEYSSQVSLLDNEVSHNMDGVTVSDSVSVQLVANAIYNNSDPTGYNGFGILLSGSWLCDLVGNTVCNNSGFGIMTVECMNCSLFSNQLGGNGRYMSYTSYGANFDSTGIAIGHSTGIILEANSLQGNGVSVYGDLEEHYATLTISPYNLVNGLPVRYYAYSDGVVCDSLPAGQVLVFNCTDSVFTGLDIPAAEVAITIRGSDNVTVSDCHMTGENAVGVKASLMGDLRLTGNSYDYMFSGVVAMAVENVSIQADSMAAAAIAATLWDVSHAEVVACVVGPASIGLSFDEVDRVLVEDCTIEGCGGGIWAGGYSLAEFRGNDISSCLHALSAISSSPVIVQDNHVWANDEGIILTWSVGALVNGNDVSDNTLVGLVLNAAEECQVYGNDFSGDAILAMDTAGSSGPSTNSWDDGYPGGGNYWSNYSGLDEMSGADQDVDGPDGIGDTPYVFDFAVDRYPLMHPLGSDAPPAAWFTVQPAEGGTWTPFAFNATLTYDREDPLELLQFRWDWNGDTTWDTGWSADPTAMHSFAASGTYLTRLEVMDTSGHTNTTSGTVLVSIEDDAAPVVSVAVAGDEGEDGWFVSEVTFSISASDDVSGIDWTEYRVAGAVDWTEYVSSATFSTDGEWVLEARVHDHAGNVGEQSFMFKLDCTAPVTSSSVDRATVTLVASDATSGVVATYYQIDDGGWALYGGPFEVEGRGSHTVEYYSVDEAGNEEEVKTLEVEESSAAGWLNLDMWVVLLTMLIIIGISIGLLYGMRKRATDSAGLAVNKTMPSVMAQMEEDRSDLPPKQEPPKSQGED